MDYIQVPPKVKLPARKTTNDDDQAHDFISDLPPSQRQHFDIRLRLFTSRFFSFLFQDQPSLPITNNALSGLVPTPLPKDTTLHRRRSKFPRDSRTRTQESILPKDRPDTARADERNNNREEYGEQDNAGLCGSTLSTFGNREKKHDALKKRHNIRVGALKKVLGSMSPENGSPMVLLCWGESSHCSILPVPIANSEDDVETWREIHRAWYARRGYWRKHLPGYSITQVDAVKISLLGLKKASKGRDNCEYIGMYTERDVPAERKLLQQTIDNYVPISDCFYNRRTGTVECGCDCNCFSCLPCFDDAGKCPEETYITARRNIVHLNTLHLMKHAFSNPDLAVLNDFLRKENLLYSHRDVLGQTETWNSWHCPALRDIEFRGIVVSEGWALDKRHMTLPLLVAILLGVVVAARFLFGWDTAWTVGAFFVALISLLLCISYQL